MTDSTPLTPAERGELNELAQVLHGPTTWSAAPLLARALDELARLQIEVEVLRSARPNTRT